MPVFARKPAPIQVTGFGHATGTGLQTMDYVLADPIFIPQSARHLLAEKVHDLPCLITIDPILDVPPSELPMLRNGHVTFGVFNRIYKISDEAIRVWSRLMREVTGSKIIIKHGLLDDPLLRDGLDRAVRGPGHCRREYHLPRLDHAPRASAGASRRSTSRSIRFRKTAASAPAGISLCGRSGRRQARHR
ncbi:hypothetical protein ACU4GH_14505 [Bradyrhizobium betae]